MHDLIDLAEPRPVSGWAWEEINALVHYCLPILLQKVFNNLFLAYYAYTVLIYHCSLVLAIASILVSA